MTATETLFAAVLDATTDAVMVTDRDGRIVQINPAFESLTGHSTDALVGQDARVLFRDVNEAEICDQMWSAQPGPKKFQTIRSKHADGHAQTHALDMRFIENRNGTPSQYLAVVLSNSIQNKDKGESDGRRVGHDPLTGLPDRSLLEDRVAQNILTAKRSDKSIALLVMGLDRFTVINDALGYSAGDQLLKEVAERLSEVIRSSDTAARLDGDKFAVMTPISAIDDSVIVAEKVLKSVRQPFHLEGEEIVVTFSIGISILSHGQPNLRRAPERWPQRHAIRQNGWRRRVPVFRK